jgi:hypothetical protein
MNDEAKKSTSTHSVLLKLLRLKYQKSEYRIHVSNCNNIVHYFYNGTERNVYSTEQRVHTYHK